MHQLKWWMRIVGTLYILLGIGFIPLINEARLPQMLPTFTAPPDTVEYKALIDWTFIFGLDLLVTGAVLIYGARNPLKNMLLVWLVIWLEAIRGVLADIYYILRGYASVPFYLGFIVVHVIIIVTGIIFLRQARATSTQ